MGQKILEKFPAFESKGYQLYFGGQFVSFFGSHLQAIAHSWLVLQLTNSAYWFGISSALGTLPTLLFTLFGGVLVDRFNRKKLLIITQTLSMILAFILGFLVITNNISLWILLLITFIAGVISSIDNPASQAFVVEVVHKKNIASATGLNSMMFNFGRVVGPAIAGGLMALWGAGWMFLLNGISFLVIIGLLPLIKVTVEKKEKNMNENPLFAIHEGLRYTFSHPALRTLFIYAGFGSIFCVSVGTMIPVIAKEIFHQQESGLGLLLTAQGVGAIIASIVIALTSQQKKPDIFILGGTFLFVIATLLLSIVHNLYIGLILISLLGLGSTIQFSRIFITIQNLVEERFRGRISSIYMMIFIGFSPIGSLLVGYLSEQFGVRLGIRFASLIMASFAICMLVLRNQVRRSYIQFQKRKNGSQKASFVFIKE